MKTHLEVRGVRNRKGWPRSWVACNFELRTKLKTRDITLVTCKTCRRLWDAELTRALKAANAKTLLAASVKFLASL